jgi:hypothetical protein
MRGAAWLAHSTSRRSIQGLRAPFSGRDAVDRV